MQGDWALMIMNSKLDQIWKSLCEAVPCSRKAMDQPLFVLIGRLPLAMEEKDARANRKSLLVGYMHFC